MAGEDGEGSAAAHVRGRRIALALEAASRDAHGYEKRALDCVLPAPGNGHTAHAAQGAQVTDFVRAQVTNFEDEGTDFGGGRGVRAMVGLRFRRPFR